MTGPVARMVAKRFQRLYCLFGKHARGVRDNDRPVNVGEQGYRCPCCKATWTRKTRKVREAK